jgi:hypothetical protein
MKNGFLTGQILVRAWCCRQGTGNFLNNTIHHTHHYSRRRGVATTRTFTGSLVTGSRRSSDYITARAKAGGALGGLEGLSAFDAGSDGFIIRVDLCHV